MQYPIIDLITDAYINNGWTGLDISTGKNLAYIEYIGRCPSVSNGQFVDSPAAYTSNYIDVSESLSYTITLYDNTEYLGSCYIFVYDENNNFLSYSYFNSRTPYVLNVASNVHYIYLRFDRSNPSSPISTIQVEKGSISTPYEPYRTVKNDFPNRLKLPLPHYFPHPVIDALQRAAASTQTADDTEILQHYLTPLGIGGI